MASMEKKMEGMRQTLRLLDEEPSDAAMEARVQKRIEELVAMGYEQMLRERLVLRSHHDGR